LVHISQLSNTFVTDPNSVVKLQQKVMVTILEVDIARKRISLSMKGALQKKEAPSRSPKPKAQQETAEDFQAKLMALKKKFK
jgi:protein Tex